MRTRLTGLLIVGVAVVAPVEIAAQWAQFRGPNGAGVGEGAGYPIEFSPSKNVAWKVDVPFGQSVPREERGIVTSLDPATGTFLKEGRATGALGVDNASPVAVDGKVYLANQEGKVTVIKAGAEWEILSVNDVGGEINATPALAGGHLYVRTRGAMYCVAPPAVATAPSGR